MAYTQQILRHPINITTAFPVQSQNGRLYCPYQIEISAGAIAAGDLPPLIAQPGEEMFLNSAIYELIIEGDTKLPAGTTGDLGVYAAVDGCGISAINSKMFFTGQDLTNGNRTFWEPAGLLLGQQLFAVMEYEFVQNPEDFTNFDRVDAKTPFYIGLAIVSTAAITLVSHIQMTASFHSNLKYNPITQLGG